MPVVKDDTPLDDLIASRQQELADLEALKDIVQRNPDLVVLVADRIRDQSDTLKRKSVKETDVAVRSTNVGTTEAIIDIVTKSPDSTTRQITREIVGKSKPISSERRQAIAATLAMLTKRGRLTKTVKDGLNHYRIASE